MLNLGVIKLEDYLKLCRRYKRFRANEIKPNMLEYLHKTDLMILKEIVSIFNKNNINYVAVGGTLLGAITRGGFIPWDEDIDIAVFEEDYEKMIYCLIRELSSRFILQCEETESNYYHEWVKVRDLNSEIYPISDNYKVQGVWVDIYKMTLIEKRQIELIKVKQHKNYLLKRFQKGGINKQELNHKLEENRLDEKIRKESLRLVDSQDTEECYLIGTASKPMVEKKYVFPLKKYKFEGLELTSFNNAEAYLCNHYGESWKMLPSEKDRYIAIQGVKFNAPPHENLKML